MSDAADSETTKLFISHASEDKDGFVEPLKLRLQEAGFDIWYDKDELSVGDSLLQKISKAMSECNFGVVVLSPHYIAKKWPRAELDGLFALETNDRKVILPVWKDVTEDDVRAFSPILAGKLATRSDEGLEKVVAAITQAARRKPEPPSRPKLEDVIRELADLNKESFNKSAAEKVEKSARGVRVVREGARKIIADLRRIISQLDNSHGGIHFHIKSDKYDGPETLGLVGSYAVHIQIHYGNNYSNDVRQGFLGLQARRDFDDGEVIKTLEFDPRFLDGERFFWYRGDTSEKFDSEELSAFLLNEVIQIYREAGGE